MTPDARPAVGGEEPGRRVDFEEFLHLERSAALTWAVWQFTVTPVPRRIRAPA